MGMSEFYGPGDEAEIASPPSIAPSTSASTSWTPPTCTGSGGTKSWSAALCADAATRWSWPPSSAMCGEPKGEFLGSQRAARVRAPGLRCESAAPRGRGHRPLLPAPRRPGDAHRGHRRRHGRTGARGQGPLPGPVRGCAGHTPPRLRRPSHRRAADRVLAVEPRPRRRDSRHLPRARAWASWPTARSGAAS